MKHFTLILQRRLFFFDSEFIYFFCYIVDCHSCLCKQERMSAVAESITETSPNSEKVNSHAMDGSIPSNAQGSAQNHTASALGTSIITFQT